MSVRTAQRWTSEPREVFIKRANEKRVRVQELRAEGLSIRAIAAEIGCSVGIVHRYVKEAEENKTRSEEHTSELQSRGHLVCRLLLEKKKQTYNTNQHT